MGAITPYTTTDKPESTNEPLEATAIPVLVPNKGLQNEQLIKKYLTLADGFTKVFQICLVVLVVCIIVIPFLGWFGILLLLVIARNPLSWLYVAVLLTSGVAAFVFDRKAAKLLKA